MRYILQWHLLPLGGSGAYAVYIGKVEEKEPCCELHDI